ncbi:MAG: hypothetical protein ABEJ36_00610 [Candidatus Nanosalina sp.]
MLDRLDLDIDVSTFEPLIAWFRTPKPGGGYVTDYEKERFHEKDDIWHHEEVFSGDEILIESTTEWYESPNVGTIYEDHKYLFNQNMDMNKPFETFYFQNADTGEFKSEMNVGESLPSDNGTLNISVTIKTKNAPSGENNFAMMDYSAELDLEYGEIPNGINWLPRILAYPLNRMFRYYFIRYIGEEMLEYDIEYARERFKEYFQYIRKYHGEEPVQTKSRQAHFETPYEGTFFE